MRTASTSCDGFINAESGAFSFSRPASLCVRKAPSISFSDGEFLRARERERERERGRRRKDRPHPHLSLFWTFPPDRSGWINNARCEKKEASSSFLFLAGCRVFDHRRGISCLAFFSLRSSLSGWSGMRVTQHHRCRRCNQPHRYTFHFLRPIRLWARGTIKTL